MTATATLPAHEPDQAALLAALQRVKDRLDPAGAAKKALKATRETPVPLLDGLAHALGMSAFEKDVLLLCAGVDLDASFAPLVAQAHGDARRAQPTFGLALASLEGAHWSALLPDAPLRRWRLVEPAPHEPLSTAPLRIDERVLHHLVGLRPLDERVATLVTSIPAPGPLVRSQEALAERVAATWTQAPAGPLPVVQLLGSDAAALRAVAARAAQRLGLALFQAPADLLPASPADLETFLRAWSREYVLAGRLLLVETADADAHDAARAQSLQHLAERMPAPLLLAGGHERRTLRARPLVALDVGRPTDAEQRALWDAALQDAGLGADPAPLVSQFPMGAGGIRAACADAAGRAPATPEEAHAALWEACRAQARPRLGHLAQRIETRAGWDDLVLPPSQKDALRALAAHVKHRRLVHEEWGFADQGDRGLGTSALFAGESGTGKTLAAEVIAHELRLDLWRIDLSQVVSKYIGETEKNLRRVFDAAEEGGAILLFDEADALFGKRSEVKDSHDRYANVEVSYLLQRMEAYRGLSVLTTNLKDSIDSAFHRRLRHVIHFPFPDAASRAEIWRRAFPPRTPTRGLDFDKLARLNVAGGAIRNVAMNAAFLAAEEASPVTMAHLLRAAHAEYSKLERTITDGETRGWVP